MVSVYEWDRLIAGIVRAVEAYMLGCVAGEGGKPHDAEVTVLVPCYKKAAYVKEAVASALKQSRKPDAVHVLLMDEESRSLKEELEALSPLVSCEEHERLRLSDARNRLAERCGTEFMALLDADDLLAPNFFERMLSRDADFTLARHIAVRDGKRMFKEPLEPFLAGNLAGVFRTEAFLGLGGCDPRLNRVGREDTDFLLSAVGSGRTVVAREDTRTYLRRDTGSFRSTSAMRSRGFRFGGGAACRVIMAKHLPLVEKAAAWCAENAKGEICTCLENALSLWRRAT